MKKRKINPLKVAESFIESARAAGRSIKDTIEITLRGQKPGSIQYFSNDLPPLIIKIANAKREIEVEVSSVQADNEQLLHYLFRKTVEKS